MLVNIISEKSLDKIAEVIAKSNPATQAYELRLDYLGDLENINFEQLAEIKAKLKTPVIFTIRTIRDKGKYNGPESLRLELLFKLCELNPDYIDLENYVADDFIKKIKVKFPNVKMIRSFHDFSNHSVSIDKLSNILSDLKNECVDIYKICLTATSSIDNLYLLEFLRKNNNYKIAAHLMGELGQASRILGKIFGGFFTYAIDKNTEHVKKKRISRRNILKTHVPWLDRGIQTLINYFGYRGQAAVCGVDEDLSLQLGLVSINELIDVYHYNSLNQSTKIYALLGDPVRHSIGHIYHNDNFKRHGNNAVYVKLKVSEQELANFFDTLKKLGFLNFAGFSITMPLKNLASKYLSESSPINTIKIENKNMYGINTDGEGCVQAIIKYLERELNGLNALVLGAGGAANAIVTNLSSHGANLFVYNRTLNKAKELADKYNGNVFNFNKNDNINFDIVINTLPESITAGNYELLTNIMSVTDSNGAFMDINYNNPVKIEKVLNIPGKEMFYQQADLQYKYWCE